MPGRRKQKPVWNNRIGTPEHCNKQSCIVLEGTPDLSGSALNDAIPLPHECGVPSQCSGRPNRIQPGREQKKHVFPQNSAKLLP
jgi:hypothetical protein